MKLLVLVCTAAISNVNVSVHDNSHHGRDTGCILWQVCDDLDFVPMDEFQKKFFLLRQGEWLDYKEQFPGYVPEAYSNVSVCHVLSIEPSELQGSR